MCIRDRVLSICILCSHILSKKCRFRFERPVGFGHMTRQIVLTGFSTFFIDIAMGILSMMFNNQIMKYSGSPALAVYGVIINVNTLVQACAYGVGPVSYTHLDVYKRQVMPSAAAALRTVWFFL